MASLPEVSLGSYHRFCEKGVSITSQTQSLKIGQTMIFCKAQHFLLTGLLKGKPNSFGTRSLNHLLPPSPMDYDRAQQYLAAVAFFESNEPDPVEVGEVTKNRERVVASIEQIDVVQACWEAEALPDAPPSKYCCTFPQLLQRPPAIDLRPDFLLNRAINSVIAPPKRCMLVNRLNNELLQSEGSESLLTEEACSAYKAEIEQIVSDQSGSHATSPSDWYVAEFIVADRTRVKIKEQARIEQCLLQIHRLNRDLNSTLNRITLASVLKLKLCKRTFPMAQSQLKFSKSCKT